MANQFDAVIPKGRERIAFKRLSNNQATTINGDKNNSTGVLVIDPSMVYDQYGKIVDRYVKQEDMVMYCSLRAYKRSELVITDKDGIRTNEYNSTPIQINLLNPLKSRTDQSFNFKNYFTSQWTDFLTSNSANDINSEAYIIDPETFGISNIEYSINASHVPLITMTFIDIQGRTLFERGNDPNNPYNIFFSIPYPKFLLTLKGYYGKAIEVPLVFMRSNTKFNPGDGSYELTVEFQGDVFSLMQSFVVIYPYVAPYMFKMDDGTFLGQKILNNIYDQQNAAITETLGGDKTELDKYLITTYPTMWDLSNAIKKIPFNTLGNNGQSNPNAVNNDQILILKTSFENLDDGINNFFADTTKYTPTTSTKTNSTNNYDTYDVYKPVSDSYKLTNNNLSEFFEGIKTFNDNIKQIQAMSTQSDFIAGIKSRINSNNILKDVITNFNVDNALETKLFYFDGKTDVYTLLYFNELTTIVIDEVSKIEAVIEDKYVDNAITDIGKYLGYQPNMGNILRIIANNMQTFLILLEIIAINSAKQIQNDAQRVRKHNLNTTYQSNATNTVKYYSPFPQYYKIVSDGKSSKQVLTYPGSEAANQGWFEVAFVEEIYKALLVIKEKANPGKNNVLFANKKTGISTIFPFGDVDLTAYENKRQANDILAELLFKYSLHSSFSGIYYRGISQENLNTHYSANMAQFEMALINDLVLSTFSDSGSQYLLTNSIKNAIDINNTQTNLGSFSRNYLKLTKDQYTDILKSSVSEINLYKTKYTQATFDKTIASKNNKVKVNNTTLYEKLYNTDLNPIFYSLSQDKKVSQLFVYPDLSPNVSYYCNVQPNPLEDINIATKGIDNTQYNTNPFQGFLMNLNQKLQDTNINTDMTSNISYGRTTVPALTFSNLIAKNIEVFNVVEKPKENIIQKFKKILQA